MAASAIERRCVAASAIEARCVAGSAIPGSSPGRPGRVCDRAQAPSVAGSSAGTSPVAFAGLSPVAFCHRRFVAWDKLG